MLQHFETPFATPIFSLTYIQLYLLSASPTFSFTNFQLDLLIPGCDSGNINFDNFNSHESCERIIGKLVISDLKDRIPKLSNVLKLHGDLEVKDTNLKNISFLENLREIRVGQEGVININIQNNTKIKQLGFWALEVKFSLF